MSDNRSILRDAYDAARVAVESNRVADALRALEPAIRRFVDSEGETTDLVMPLIAMSDIVHRLGRPDEAHMLEDRALGIARDAAAPPTLFLADAYCLVALAEWNSRCHVRATHAYEEGIAAGERVGAGNGWLAYHCTGFSEMILEIGHDPTLAMTYATKAVLVASASDVDERTRFYARFALAKAQCEAHLHVAAKTTFEELIDLRLRSPREAGADDRMLIELRAWVAKLSGG